MSKVEQLRVELNPLSQSMKNLKQSVNTGSKLSSSETIEPLRRK